MSGARDGREVEIRLPEIDRDRPPGTGMRLVFTTTDLGFATPAEPAVYQVAITGPLVVPSVSGPKAPPPDTAWMDVGPAADRRRGAAVLVATGRRRIEARAPIAGLRGDAAADPRPDQALQGRQPAVEDLSFEVARGEVRGPAGPGNGAGEATALRAAHGPHPPRRGGDPRSSGTWSRPGRAGAVPSSGRSSRKDSGVYSPHLPSGTARPASPAVLRRATWALPTRKQGAHFEWRWRSPGSAEARGPRGPRVFADAGMAAARHRAGCMLGLPDLLVLDEPTNGLDPPQIARCATC
ncbi:hypothetical protein ACU686_31990 [Yinghuangia aomiensis]